MAATTSANQISASITILYFAAAQTEAGLFSEVVPLSSVRGDESKLSDSLNPHSLAEEAVAQTITGYDTSGLRSGHDSNEPRLSDLGATLVALHPNTKLGTVLESSAWSVNEEMVPNDSNDVASIRLKAGDVIAVIPPVSGG